MTVSEFENEARRLGDFESDTFISSSEIYKAIEAVCQEILAIIGLIETEDTSITTVASTQEYDYPTRMEFVERVRYDGDDLQKIGFREWDIDKGSTDPEGTPRKFVIWNKKLYLVPTPDEAKTLTIFGYSRHEDVSAATTIAIPEILHHRMINKIVYRLLMKDKDYQGAKFFLDEWRNYDLPAIYDYKRQYRTGGKYQVVTSEEDVNTTEYGII